MPPLPGFSGQLQRFFHVGSRQGADAAAAERIAAGGVGRIKNPLPAVIFQQVLGAFGEGAVGLQPQALVQGQIAQIFVATVQGADADGVAQTAR